MAARFRGELTTADAPKTLTDVAYQRLRQEIIAGRFAAGSRLRVEHLRDEYELGATPLREALSRLAAERLVDAIGQRGFRVAPMSLAELADITETRVLLEGQALEQSIERGGIDWEARVVAAHHAVARLDAQNKTSAPPTPSEREARNTDFHDALVSACGSRWLLELRGIVYDQHRRYRYLAFEHYSGSRDLAKEHRGIFDAALKRDPARAKKLVAEHIRATATALRKALAERLPEHDVL